MCVCVCVSVCLGLPCATLKPMGNTPTNTPAMQMTNAQCPSLVTHAHTHTHTHTNYQRPNVLAMTSNNSCLNKGYINSFMSSTCHITWSLMALCQTRVCVCVPVCGACLQEREGEGERECVYPK